MIFSFIIPISLVLLGFIVGRINEARHFADLEEREDSFKHVVLSDLKTIPEGMNRSQFVSGSVVISIDYYKRIIASIRMFFGGEVASYQSLLTRARREAILRMIDEADDYDSKYIANIRIETSKVFENDEGIGSLEVYAYGTALS
ncbi:MAG: YbjQ family protein [Robiginitomaculum sp.]|nr:YbjQ family protein [Robiginitomaculum sp.]